MQIKNYFREDKFMLLGRHRARAPFVTVALSPLHMTPVATALSATDAVSTNTLCRMDGQRKKGMHGGIEKHPINLLNF